MENSILIHEAIGRAYEVYNQLGFGFLEKVYENALIIELQSIRRTVEQQSKVIVYYKQQEVGFYKPDLMVDHQLIIELKSGDEILSVHRSQLQNYLQATGIDFGLILNFSPTGVEYRKVLKF